MCIYLLHIKPFESILTYRLEVLNEVTLVLMTSCMLTFSDIIDDDKARNLIGWAVVGIFCLNFLINIIVMLVNTFLLMYQTIKAKTRRS